MRRSRLFRFATATLSIAAVTALLLPGPTFAAATVAQARWEMNEPAGATTMNDSLHGMHGAIGSAVVTGVVVDGATAYRWPFVKPNEPPAKPQRLVQVADPRLIPGTRDFAVTLRYRTTRKFGNIIQKGQAKYPGGYFKVEQPGGYINCFFTGKGGKAAIKSPFPTNDGRWHVVRCERTTSGVKLSIDGAVVGQYLHATGTIGTTLPLVIGGKLNCDNVTITCDYFTGDIDYVVIETS